MPQVLQGLISPTDGLREVLEIIVTLKHVNSGVLEISSGENSGRVGIAWGRFITGALMDNGLTGKVAVRELLGQREGRFTFIDTEGEPVSELRQSLGVDLNGVVMSVPHFTPQTAPWLFEQSELMEAFAQTAAERQHAPVPVAPEPAPIAAAEPDTGETNAGAFVPAETAGEAPMSAAPTATLSEETNSSAAAVMDQEANGHAAPTLIGQTSGDINLAPMQFVPPPPAAPAIPAEISKFLDMQAVSASAQVVEMPDQESFHTDFDLKPAAAEQTAQERASLINELDKIAPHLVAGQSKTARPAVPPPLSRSSDQEAEDEEAAETLRLARAEAHSLLVAKQQEAFERAMKQGQQAEPSISNIEIDPFYGTDPTLLRRSNNAPATKKIDLDLATGDLRVAAIRAEQAQELPVFTPAPRERTGPNVSKLRTARKNNSMAITLVCIIFFLLSCAVTVLFGPKLFGQITNSAPLARHEK